MSKKCLTKYLSWGVLTVFLLSCASTNKTSSRHLSHQRKIAATPSEACLCKPAHVEATYESIYKFIQKNLGEAQARELFSATIAGRIILKNGNPYELKPGESIDRTLLPGFYGTRLALVKSQADISFGPLQELVQIKNTKSKAQKKSAKVNDKKLRTSLALCSGKQDSGWVETRNSSPNGSMVYAVQTEEVLVNYDSSLEVESLKEALAKHQSRIAANDYEQILESLSKICSLSI